MSKLLVTKRKARVSDEMRSLLRMAGDADYFKARAAQLAVTKALNLPLREGILHGDIVSGIFEETFFEAGQTPEWPKSFLTPDNAGDFVAYVSPQYGKIPQRQIAGDYVMVPTYMIQNAIDCSLRYIRDSRWDVVGKMEEVVLNGHVRKKNDDGFHTLLAAAAARNLVVNDSQAASGLFTKRLVSLMQTKMARLGGGNTASMGRRRLTDMYVSLECTQDMRAWDLTQIDEVTRREIFLATDEDQALNSIFGVRIHPLFELGVGQPYQTYTANTLGASVGSKEEFVLGLDLVNNDSFVMPIRQYVELHPDPMLHRELKFGMYSLEEYGFGVLENRSVLLGAA